MILIESSDEIVEKIGEGVVYLFKFKPGKAKLIYQWLMIKGLKASEVFQYEGDSIDVPVSKWLQY